LNGYLGEYDNEFQAAGATPPGMTPPPGTTTPPPGTGTTPPPSVGDPGSGGPTTPAGSVPPVSTPPSTGPGGPGSSPGGPGGPGTSPGSVPTPQVPDVPTPGTTSPSFAGPGQVPGSGVPGGPGSAGTPGTPGVPGVPDVSVPGSSLPGVGTPGVPGSAIPGAGSAPKEVTIQDGDRKITVGQPDAQGRSKITVDDGKGEPREYLVDFTDDPGEQPEDGVIRAENGKAVIQDGDAAISLEQVPGPTDRLKMTVDDGTPETYDVDFGPDSQVPGLPDVPRSPHASLPDIPTPASVGGDHHGGGAGGGVGGGVGGGGGGGGSYGGAHTPGTSAPAPGAMIGAGSQESTGADRAAASATPGSTGGSSDTAQGRQGGAIGGMPMGAMGAGGQGGDTTRQSKWRTTGELFDDPDPAANFSGVVGRDPADKPKSTPKR
jgi:hypothetical protein